MKYSTIVFRQPEHIRAAQSFLRGVVRTLFYLTVGASGIAVLVSRWHAPAAGRSIAGTSSSRSDSGPMRVVVNATTFAPTFDQPWMLDPESGRLHRLELQEEVVLRDAGVSSRRDERGRWHVAGRWWRRTGHWWGLGNFETGLMRSTFPGGEVLDRIVCDPYPVGPPCWFPDGPDRIVYPTANGSLYYFQFKDESTVAPDPGSAPVPCRLTWRSPATDHQVLAMMDPIWPADPRFRRMILVSLVHLDRNADGVKSSRWQIWWLRISEGGDSIDDAGRLIESETEIAAAPFDERFPSLAGSRNGLVLAYLTLAPHPTGWQLRVAPVDIDPGTGTPRAHLAAGRIIADQRLPVRPAFSADGRWVASGRDGADPSRPVDRYVIGDCHDTMSEPSGCARIQELVRFTKAPGNGR